MKTIRKVLAAVVCMAMLLGSVPVLAAEKPDKAKNPSWGDAWDVSSYVISDYHELVDFDDEDELYNYLTHYFPEGTIILNAKLWDEWEKIAKIYWNGTPGEYWDLEGDDRYSLLLTGDALTNYSRFYDLAIEMFETKKIATGEYYFEWDEETEERVDPLWIALEAARNLAYSVYDRTGDSDSPLWIVPDDTESVDEDVMWVRQSDWDAFNAEMEAVNAILGEDWDITRVQAQELAERYTNIFNTLNAAVENGNLTPATPSETPQTPAGTPSVTPSEASAPAATGTTTVAAAVAAIPTTSSVKGVKTTVDGAYFIKKVDGVAFTTPLADIVAGYGIASGEKAYAMVWDLNPEKSYLAKAVIDNTASALGAEVGPALNIELGKKDAAGKFSLLSQDGPAVTVMVGVPASFVEEGKTLAVVRVRPGGAVSILADLDADADTVTFTTTGGAGAYAIVKY